MFIQRKQKRFNGAATFPSRMLGHALDIEINPALLQWGRDVSVADASFCTPFVVPPIGLQWGRDVSVADASPVR